MCVAWRSGKAQPRQLPRRSGDDEGRLYGRRPLGQMRARLEACVLRAAAHPWGSWGKPHLAEIEQAPSQAAPAPSQHLLTRDARGIGAIFGPEKAIFREQER